MKSFFKTVLATIVGVFVASFVMVVLFFMMLIVSSPSETYDLKNETILALNLSGIVTDRVNPVNPVLQYMGLADQEEVALADILSAIKKAKENDKIKGIYIKAGSLYTGNASLMEIRKELKAFKESGKFIVAYGDAYFQGCYYLASVADKVILNPSGNLDIHGLSSSPTFYKGTLDKLGIEMQVFKVGTFKSAVEPYMQEKMSDANREQVTAFINDIWDTVVAEISADRNITPERLNEIANTLPMMQGASLMIDYKLADELMYETEVKKYLAELTNKEKVKDLRLASVSDLKTVSFLNKPKSSDRIAVLYAEGSIVSGNQSMDINDRYYVKEIEKLREDKDVKAIVFRVNSPGGSAYASEQIWKAITDLKAEKPVVVSMGDYAASGGYYIACNASKIIAEPTTLTGSIGIFGMIPNLEGLNNKIGLSHDNVKTNEYADFPGIIRPLRENEKEIMQSFVERGYDLFITRCAEGRGIPKDSIDRIGQGRVWTGNQALKLGLIDALGNIDTAIEEAAKLAELETYSVKEYPRQKDFWEILMSNKKDEIAVSAIKEYFGDDYQLIKTIREIKNIKEQDYIQARLPFDFDIR